MRDVHLPGEGWREVVEVEVEVVEGGGGGRVVWWGLLGRAAASGLRLSQEHSL
jgi:hypothetical protein